MHFRLLQNRLNGDWLATEIPYLHPFWSFPADRRRSIMYRRREYTSRLGSSSVGAPLLCPSSTTSPAQPARDEDGLFIRAEARQNSAA